MINEISLFTYYKFFNLITTQKFLICIDTIRDSIVGVFSPALKKSERYFTLKKKFQSCLNIFLKYICQAFLRLWTIINKCQRLLILLHLPFRKIIWEYLLISQSCLKRRNKFSHSRDYLKNQKINRVISKLDSIYHC